jgi:hypothetical protein
MIEKARELKKPKKLEKPVGNKNAHGFSNSFAVLDNHLAVSRAPALNLHVCCCIIAYKLAFSSTPIFVYLNA